MNRADWHFEADALDKTISRLAQHIRKQRKRPRPCRLR
jgi:hypothetical protein